jgi:hypothetical protein
VLNKALACHIRIFGSVLLLAAHINAAAIGEYAAAAVPTFGHIRA